MSPLDCPKGFLEYNACLGCSKRHKAKLTSGDECWARMPISEKLANILTLEERIAILENRKEVPPVDIVTITYQDYQQLQRLILSLEEKINSHIDKTKSKKKSYNKYD